MYSFELPIDPPDEWWLTDEQIEEIIEQSDKLYKEKCEDIWH